MRPLGDSRFSRYAPVLAGAVLASFLTGISANAFDPYVVDGLQVSVEAASAVEAKDEALTVAVSRGLERVLDRVTRPADRRRLPARGNALADQLLDRLSIESERFGPTVYSASFRVAFSPLAVRGFLHGHGAAVIDRPAPPVLLVPVHEHDAIPLWWEAADEWAAALAGVSFEDGLTPARMPDNSSADRRESRERLLAADRVTLGDFRVRYRTQGVVVAVARTVPGRDRVGLSLIGEDAAGFVDHSEELASGGLVAAAERVAELLSVRWKSALAGQPRPQADELSAFPVRVLLPGGRQEWEEIERRLSASGQLAGLAVERTSATSFDVTIWHSGGRRELATRLMRHGLDLFEAGDLWLLQSY